MKKGIKPNVKHLTRATGSREPSTTNEPKRMAKGERKKQSISGQRRRREKEGARAETGAGVSNIHVSEISHGKAQAMAKTRA
jgi:hypothetical protein